MASNFRFRSTKKERSRLAISGRIRYIIGVVTLDGKSSSHIEVFLQDFYLGLLIVYERDSEEPSRKLQQQGAWSWHIYHDVVLTLHTFFDPSTDNRILAPELTIIKKFVQIFLCTFVDKLFFTRCTSMNCKFRTTDGAPEEFVLQRFDTAPFCCKTVEIIITNLHRWITHLLSSALICTKMWKKGSMNGSQQKGRLLLRDAR